MRVILAFFSIFFQFRVCNSDRAGVVLSVANVPKCPILDHFKMVCLGFGMWIPEASTIYKLRSNQ